MAFSEKGYTIQSNEELGFMRAFNLNKYLKAKSSEYQIRTHHNLIFLNETDENNHGSGWQKIRVDIDVMNMKKAMAYYLIKKPH